MREYILLLPLIFIFHDMEELAGFGWFFRNNPWLFERFPNVMNTYKGFTNEGFTLAVYEEFIPFFGVSLLAYYFPCSFLYGLSCGRIADPVGLDPDTDILTVLCTEVVFPLIKDPVKEPGLIAFHKIQKDFVILVDQHEPFVRIALPVSVHQFFFCNAHVRILHSTSLEVWLAGLRHLLLTYVILRNSM